MKFSDFQYVLSSKRLERYLKASKNRKRKAMSIYNENLRLSKEVYVLVSYFEVTLRNAIDRQLVAKLGEDWLRDAVQPGGIFDNPKCHDSYKIIKARYESLARKDEYTHSKLLSSLEFGIWRYMFSPSQYKATGQVLLKVFPKKPKSTPQLQYNNVYFFNELNYINTLRNRIAHQEPICFSNQTNRVDTAYVHAQYERIMILFKMMGIDSKKLLQDMDMVENACVKMELLGG